MPSNERHTLATSTTEITTAISRLRTARRHHFSPGSPTDSPVEPAYPEGPTETKPASATRLLVSEEFGQGEKGHSDSALSFAFRPSVPAQEDKVLLTFLPSYPNSPRISPDQVKEAPFYPLTRGPVYTRTPYVDSPFFHSNGPPVGPKLTAGGSPVYHHLAHTSNGPPVGSPFGPGPASHSGILPDRERSSAHSAPAPHSPNTNSASPTLQARLQVLNEKKVSMSPPTLRKEPRPSPSHSPAPPLNPQDKKRPVTPSTPTPTTTPISPGSLVTGAPANLSCSGKIGYFSDPSPSGCDTFLYCDQFGRSYRFLCPQGTQFNPRLCLCDLHSPCLDGQEKVTRLISPDDPCPPLL